MQFSCAGFENLMNGRSPPPGPPPTAASKRSTSANRQAAVAFWTTVYFPTWGRILGRNPNKSLAIHCHVSLAFPWDFFFFKLTQPLTVSRVQLLYTVKEKEGKPVRKPYPFPYGLTNPHRNRKVENSQAHAQKPQQNCMFMNLASGQLAVDTSS